MDREDEKERKKNEGGKENKRGEMERKQKDEAYIAQLKSDYDLLEQKLGGGGASQKVAQSLLKTIDQQLF